ncbi:hypothetical protein AAH979_15175 [Plantactinospora sp. ZYX-F-223]|uniref:hypothetical protein n=1 Tax=Plantactinospora sp. ZYX-F-223 TaxID=3144103 RepID=UPI0031FC7F0B
MRTRIGGVPAAALALLIGLALPGCGGGDGPDPGGGAGTGTSAASGGADPAGELRAAALQFSSCMRERGYDVPDPVFDERGFPGFAEPELRGDQRYEAARAECRVALDSAAVAAGAPTKDEMAEQLLAFARCMRERGVDMPDPPADGGLRLDGDLLSAPNWRPAAHACREHLPAKYADLVNGMPAGPKGTGQTK